MTEFNKSILQRGTQKASEHDRVVVEVSISIDHCPLIENQTLTFDLGHAEDFGVIKFVDDMVKTMGLNEKCLVLAKPTVLTQFEQEQLQLTEKSCKELKFELYLHDIQKLAHFWQMSESEKILISDIMKRRGNKLMKNGQIVRAYKTYKIAIETLQGSVSVTGSSTASSNDSSKSDEARLLLVHCLANAALCLLKMHQIRQQSTENSIMDSRKYLIPCINCCQKAVELEPDHAKAWFRWAKAYAGLGDFQEATDKAEQCLRCLDKQINHQQTTTPNQLSVMLNQVHSSLHSWRQQANQQAVEERTKIHQMASKSDRLTNNWFDEDDELEKLPISVWSNDLAENMMSLHEELEAFGEKMPEYHVSSRKRKGNRPTGNRHHFLNTIDDDEDSDEM